MPLREYTVKQGHNGCSCCRFGFEQLERASDDILTVCPHCGAPVQRAYSAPQIGASSSGLDDRAKSAGFTKFKKVSHGEYEKQY